MWHEQRCCKFKKSSVVQGSGTVMFLFLFHYLVNIQTFVNKQNKLLTNRNIPCLYPVFLLVDACFVCLQKSEYKSCKIFEKLKKSLYCFDKIKSIFWRYLQFFSGFQNRAGIQNCCSSCWLIIFLVCLQIKHDCLNIYTK